MEATNIVFSDASSESSSVISNISDLSNLNDNNCEYRFLSYEIVTGQQINSNLLYTKDEKQFYRFNSSNKNADAYLCFVRNCKQRVHLRKDKMCVQKKRYFTHNHATQEKFFEELKILNLVKSKCADISTLFNEKKQSVRNIFYSVLSNYPNVKMDFYENERCLQLIRNSVLPKNPTTCDDIAKIFEREDIMKLLGTTKDGKAFYNGVFECEECSFCVFSSKGSIELFSSRVKYGDRVIMIDGTFAVVPIGSFDQLLIVYAVYMEKVIYILCIFSCFEFFLFFSYIHFLDILFYLYRYFQ